MRAEIRKVIHLKHGSSLITLPKDWYEKRANRSTLLYLLEVGDYLILSYKEVNLKELFALLVEEVMKERA